MYDKNLSKPISIRLPFDIFEKLQEEASSLRVSISNVIREKVLRTIKTDLVQVKSVDHSSGNEENQKRENLEPYSEIDFALVEILFLFREFLFERNAQVLKKVDQKLIDRFGESLKRIR